jgi:hypothetical protein
MTIDHKTQTQETYEAPILFIVSSGRSGSTLLRSILNATEEIFIPYESDFIARAYPHYHQKTTFSESDYRQITKLFYEATEVSGWGMDANFIFSKLKQVAPQSFADINSVLYDAYLKANELGHIPYGIKAPVLIASLDRIFETYPHAKLLHIVRDGRDVYLSYQQVHANSEVKFGPKSLIANVLYWVDGLRRVAEFKKQYPEIPTIELRYEDMLTQPDIALRQVCDFLGISYRSAIHEDFYKLERNQKLVSSDHMNSFHSKVRSALDANNIRKYVNRMTRLQKFIYELLSAPYLEKYDYPVDYPLLKLFIFDLIRLPCYWFAHSFNDIRYQKRDVDTLNRAIVKYANILSQESFQ